MLKLLYKEMKLTASPLSYIFIIFGLMSFLPGYPISLSAFFVCLGLFQTFQRMREANDITYTALLPVAKSDIVKAKFLFCIVIEGCYFLLTSIPTLLRMTVLSNAPAYVNNALMTANFVYLGYVLLILAVFNLIFVGGFFKTAYKFAKPFICFIVVASITVGVSETLFHFPALSSLNAFGFTHIATQLCALGIGIITFAVLTLISLRLSIKNFEKIDL